jgi:NADH dehydrogenase (ubiquinone) 1 alpha subcomplex subunit 8
MSIVDRIKDINTHCLKQFNAHWECLENNNQNLWECRKPEMELNSCVFEKLVRPYPPLHFPQC